MIIRKYGLELRRLKVEDIELVRRMRNLSRIREKMFYQKEISISEQKAWFDKINNEKHYYFIIYKDQQPLGLIHGIVVSFEQRIAEGGIFMWDENSDSLIPCIASIIMADLTFGIMNMNKTIADVRAENKIALNYNRQLGYVKVNHNLEEQKVTMELNKENYFKQSKKIKKAIHILTGDKEDLEWKDIELSGSDYESWFKDLPEYLKSQIDKMLF